MIRLCSYPTNPTSQPTALPSSFPSCYGLGCIVTGHQLDAAQSISGIVGAVTTILALFVSAIVMAVLRYNYVFKGKLLTGWSWDDVKAFIEFVSFWKKHEEQDFLYFGEDTEAGAWGAQTETLSPGKGRMRHRGGKPSGVFKKRRHQVPQQIQSPFQSLRMSKVVPVKGQQYRLGSPGRMPMSGSMAVKPGGSIVAGSMSPAGLFMSMPTSDTFSSRQLNTSLNKSASFKLPDLTKAPKLAGPGILTDSELDLVFENKRYSPSQAFVYVKPRLKPAGEVFFLIDTFASLNVKVPLVTASNMYLSRHHLARNLFI